MSGQKSMILSAFNDHFSEFITDVNNVFPKDADILAAKNSLTLIRKANPKIIIGIWNSHIVSKYKSAIEKGDIGFFIEKKLYRRFKSKCKFWKDYGSNRSSSQSD